LPARGRGAEAATGTKVCVCAAQPKPLDKCPASLFGRRQKLKARHGIVADHVHVATKLSGKCSQFVGAIGRVVDARKQDVLDRHLSMPRLVERLRGGHHVGQRMPPRQRDQPAAESVIGRVEGNRQRDGHVLAGQAANLLWQADRRDGHVPCREAQPIRIDHRTHGRDRRAVVGQRFAHTHEHDIRHTSTRRALEPENLLDDLAGGQVSLQAAQPGGAEAASDRASDLA